MTKQLKKLMPGAYYILLAIAVVTGVLWFFSGEFNALVFFKSLYLIPAYLLLRPLYEYLYGKG